MAARELSKFEQDTLIEALTQIDGANKAKKLAEYAAAIEQEKAGRMAAEAKIGELTAELAKRQQGYQAALAELETRSLQDREARATAELLAAQARAELEGERATQAMLRQITEQISAIEITEQDEPAIAPAATPISYRVNVVGRDAAGDLRTVEIVPVEK